MLPENNRAIACIAKLSRDGTHYKSILLGFMQPFNVSGKTIHFRIQKNSFYASPPKRFDSALRISHPFQHDEINHS
jgi:hypothetical protein